MLVIGYFLKSVAVVLNLLITIYMFIIVAQAIISWVNPDPYNPIVRFLYSVTEPIYRRIRRYIPLNYGGIDFTPMAVLFALVFLREFIVSLLMVYSSSFIIK
ncbi:MAG TPA: YggT family protein [bacterium]